jgi:hypothetical protein
MAAIFFGVLFGAIGSAYIVYGKKTMSAAFAVCGVLLIVFTYFFDSAWAILLIGSILIAVPIAMARGLF